MSRTRRPGIQTVVSATPVATGGADNTVTPAALIAPSVGARIVAWGYHVTAAGSGNDTFTISLVPSGLSDTAANRLADQATTTLDAMTANSIKTANGPALGGAGAGSVDTLGHLIVMRWNPTAGADKHITTQASFVPWIQWSH